MTNHAKRLVWSLVLCSPLMAGADGGCMSTVVIGGDLANGGGGAENAGGNNDGTSTSGGAQSVGGAEAGGNGPGVAPSCFDPNAPQDYADVPLVPYQGRCSVSVRRAPLVPSSTA